MEKITDARVVAVAENNLVLKMLFVMSDLFFDVGKLRIKLVVFRFARFV